MVAKHKKGELTVTVELEDSFFNGLDEVMSQEEFQNYIEISTNKTYEGLMIAKVHYLMMKG